MRALAVVVVLAGCGPEAEAPPEADAGAVARGAIVVGARGCGDVEIAFSDPSDTHAVFVHAGGLASAAQAVGSTLRGTVTLPSPYLSVVAEAGTDLTSATCVGAFPFPGPVVDRTWEAIDGKVDVIAEPDPSGSPGFPLGTVALRLRGVRFADAATGQGFVLPDVVVPPVGVGFYPP